MNIDEVMVSLAKLYGKDKMKPFKGKDRWDAYYVAYHLSQALSAEMTDDDHLTESETTGDMVLYKTIMTAWEKVIRNKDLGYNFPDFPTFEKGEEPYTVSGRVETWAQMM